MRFLRQWRIVVRIVVGICLLLLLFPFILGPILISIPNLFRPQRECPACHAPFPKVRMWETCRQLKWDIWQCHQCGCEAGCNCIMPSTRSVQQERA